MTTAAVVETSKVLCGFVQNSNLSPVPPTDSRWRRSRYIIDNRRNALFVKKPPTVFFQPHYIEPSTEINPQQRLFPVEHKDLTAEASIREPKLYQKYDKNSLVNSYKITNPNKYKYNVGVFEKNSSGILEPQNFIPNEDDVFNNVVVTTTEKVLKELLVSVSSTASSEPKPSEFRVQTTTKYPWEVSKTEEGNQIDGNEKHVYETRIETVSFHQEVIFNPPKKSKWYPQTKPETVPVNYEEQERNYEEPEQNYEQPEVNYEEPERNYEQPERNYEESEGKYKKPSKTYDLDLMPQQETPDENQKKFGYVVEDSNYRKYRVEERTADGFIVGEYGVVSHDDGSLRGVRYTAEGNINPKLIYETLIKFLSL